jgi:integrase/recombinase XerD
VSQHAGPPRARELGRPADNSTLTLRPQALLGHAALSSTERYTHVAIGKLQRVHADTHPARLKRKRPAKISPANYERARALLEALLNEDEDEG